MNIRIKVHSNGQNNHKTILLKVKVLDIKECFHYDHTDEESIMARAKMLKGKTLGYISENSPYEEEAFKKSNKVVAVPLDAGWNDIGVWQSLYDIESKDEKGNIAKGEVFLEETSNSYIFSSDCDHQPL